MDVKEAWNKWTEVEKFLALEYIADTCDIKGFKFGALCKKLKSGAPFIAPVPNLTLTPVQEESILYYQDWLLEKLSNYAKRNNV